MQNSVNISKLVLEKYFKSCLTRRVKNERILRLQINRIREHYHQKNLYGHFKINVKKRKPNKTGMVNDNIWAKEKNK